MDYWSKLVTTISEALFPERKAERKKEEAAKAKAAKSKIVEKAVKEGEVKLGKFEDAPVLKAVPKRARTAKGRYRGDDDSTPDINEAWVGGKAPKKKAKKKKK